MDRRGNMRWNLSWTSAASEPDSILGQQGLRVSASGYKTGQPWLDASLGLIAAVLGIFVDVCAR